MRDDMRIVQVAAGYEHSLALTRAGRVVAWGMNDEGQCNVPSGMVDVVQVAADGRHLALTRADQGVAWRLNWSGQSNVPTELCDVVKVVTMDYCYSPLISYGNWVSWGEIIVPARATPTNG